MHLGAFAIKNAPRPNWPNHPKPTRLPQPGARGRGVGAEPTAATALPLHNPPGQPHPTSQALTTHPGPAYYELLPVTLSFNSPTRYHSLHLLAFFASALAGEERRSGFLVGLKRSDRLREAERSSGFRVANHPRSRRPASSPLFPPASASSPSLHCAAFPSSSSFSPVGGEPTATVVRRGEAGRRERPQQWFSTTFTNTSLYLPLAGMPFDLSPPFRLLPVFFSARTICGCVIIHVFDGIFFESSDEWFLLFIQMILLLLFSLGFLLTYFCVFYSLDESVLAHAARCKNHMRPRRVIFYFFQLGLWLIHC
jgi:hypothetical protein